MADKKYISKIKLPNTEDVYDLTLPSDADLSINSVTANQFTGPLAGNATSATTATNANYATTAGTANSVAAANISGTVTIGKGGTGSTSASGARTNLDVYSKSEVNSLIDGIDQFEYTIVESLPTASASTMHKIYLVAHTHGTSDSYDEYITIQSGTSYSWEKIGNTDIDLSGYSKKTHNHTFTGTAGTVSVSGSYTKATGVTISKGTGTANYTPAGSVSLTRSADVALNTTTVNSLSGSGSLPTLSSATTSSTGDIAYVTGASASHNLSVTHADPTFNTASVTSITGVGSLPSLTINSTSTDGTALITGLSKSGYTPSGTISASFTGNAVSGTGTFTPAGSVSLGSNTTSASGVAYVEGISSTGASASGTGTFLTGINGGSGSLTSATTSSTGDIAYVSGISSTGASGTTKYMSFSAGSLPTYSSVANVRTGGSTSSGVTLTGTVEDGVLSLSAATSSAYLTGTSTATVNSMSGTGSLPSMNFGATSGNAYITAVSGGTASATTKYLHHVHTGASNGTTGTAVTGVSGGTTSATVKYFHPSFTGTQGSTSISVTPTGSVSASFTGSKDTNVVTGGTTSYLHFSQGSTPTMGSAQTVLTGVKAAGSASLSGGVTVTPATAYLHFTQGSLPTSASVTVANGVKAQPSFTGSFTGTGAQLVGTLSTESATVNSSGSFTPSGTIGQASE